MHFWNYIAPQFPVLDEAHVVAVLHAHDIGKIR